MGVMLFVKATEDSEKELFPRGLADQDDGGHGQALPPN